MSMTKKRTSKPYVVEVKRTGKPLDKTYFKSERSAKRFARGVKVLRFVTGTRSSVEVTMKKRKS